MPLRWLQWPGTVVAMLLLTACLSSDPVDLILVGGRVWTGDPDRPWAEAVAVRGDTIAAVGDRREIEAHTGDSTEVVDAGGGMVVPGFIDSHVHFLVGGSNLASVQLRTAESPEEFTRRIAEFAATQTPGAWIRGGDWDHELWGGELPRRDWIDAVTPDNPVWINRLDGHMALANSAALAAAGVDAATGDVEGGEIVRDENGEPTGVLKDNAMQLVDRVAPPPTVEQEDAALAAAMAHVAAQGVTSVRHMGTWEDLAVFRRAHATGRLRTRIDACTPLQEWRRLRDTVEAAGRGDDWLRIGCLKGFVDGSLGSHTAAFLEPFNDARGQSGLLVNDPADLYAWTEAADRAGLQVNIHAIGDRANRLLLDIFERVADEHGPRDRRFRIEHAQHLHPDDLPRLAELDVIASMQPYHAVDDGRWAERVIGSERARTTYAFRSLMDSGVTVAFGSDWFVAPPVPLLGIHAAVTRRTLDGAHPEGWIPEEKIGVEDALRAYTVNGAYATFTETRKGSIEAGKLADLVVLDRDLTAIDPGDIPGVRVLRTLVGGRTVYRADRD